MHLPVRRLGQASQRHIQSIGVQQRCLLHLSRSHAAPKDASQDIGFFQSISESALGMKDMSLEKAFFTFQPKQVAKEETIIREAQEKMTAQTGARPSPFETLLSRATAPFLEERYGTGAFYHSTRKLTALAKQIAGKPIDYAILQMRFSDKGPSGRIEYMLIEAKNRALRNGARGDRLVVAEALTEKGKRVKEIDIKGRGRQGVIRHTQARMVVKLREGMTVEEVDQKKLLKGLKRVHTAGMLKENHRLVYEPKMLAW